MSAIVDHSVLQAVKKALKDDGRLSYAEVQGIIRSTFDSGVITVRERDDLRIVLRHSTTMSARARRALEQFLKHIDIASAGIDYVAEKSGNRNLGIPVPVLDPGPFAKHNTDLGKFSHGNFDVAYDPRHGVLWVTLKVGYEFEDGCDPASRWVVKERLGRAVKAWDNAGAHLVSHDLVLNPVILIRFKLVEQCHGRHFTVDVEKNKRREWVGWDLNIWQGSRTETLIHELGHMFGNYDEYCGDGIQAWIERRMWWHDNHHLKDTEALMNDGDEFRSRYFDHFARYVNQQFHKVSAAKYVAKVK